MKQACHLLPILNLYSRRSIAILYAVKQESEFVDNPLNT